MPPAPRTPFELLGTAPGSAARLGRLHTAHGTIDTPQFMPVGTAGTVRAQRTESLAPAGATMLLANTWHLVQKPGLDVLEAFGGLHAFMGWSGGLLTDSGGFQVFSLGEHARVDEDGMDLRHPVSGRSSRLTPESSVAAQLTIGSDIGMVLDHCVASTVSEAVAREAMERTHRWAERSLLARGDAPMGLFGIVQGAVFPELRAESAAFLRTLPFDGFAIGGLAVGESKAERELHTGAVAAGLPTDRPRYLMGVGTPLDLLEAVHRGVDLFDCILPTSLAQRGRAYTRTGRVELRRGVYRLQRGPLDPVCSCEACRRYSRAYLRHLILAGEPLGWTLLGLHNLQFWLDLMARIRLSIREGRFLELYSNERQWLDGTDEEAPVVVPQPKRRRLPPPESLGRWTLHRSPGFAGGPPFVSIRDRESGEVMHSVTAPHEEARALYVEQPGLVALAAQAAAPALVVWDVGLGAGTNAMELVHAWEAASPTRAMHLVSFERDLDALRLALAHHHDFPRLRHGGPRALLEAGEWRSARAPIRWSLHEGDARDHLDTAALPDLILWDPFSFRVDAPLWHRDTFARLRRRLGAKAAALYTYSNSTAVRLALLSAGFFVGPGVATGPKEATTVAWSGRAGGPTFGAAWLEKWARSSQRWPADLPESERPAFEHALRAHPQFKRDDPAG
jgi:queuine tRNA-ribosyltransferase